MTGLRRRGTLISLSGPDGSGKSAVADLVLATASRRGQEVQIVWHRPGYSAGMNRLRHWLRQARPSALPDADDSSAHERAFANPRVAKLWYAFAVVESIMVWAVQVRISLWRGHFVLCDRYVEDGLLDLDLKFYALQIRQRGLTKLLIELAPQPDIALLLEAPDVILDQRLSLKDEPFPDSPKARVARREAYRSLVAGKEFRVLDTSADIAETARRVDDLLAVAATT